MEHRLRPFSEKDSEGVRELILSILTKEYPFDKSVYEQSDLNKIGEVYAGERDSFFVIEERGAIVGTVGIKEESDESALLRRLFVEPGHRHKGYGTELLNKALDFCRLKGFKFVIFRCTDRMVDAMNLCKKAGFVDVEALDVSGFKIHKLVLRL